MPLLTAATLRPNGEDDLRASLQGVPLKAFSDAELTEAIAEAEDAINAFLEKQDLDSFSFKRYIEKQPWDGSFSFTPYRGPIRRIEDILVVTVLSPTGEEEGYTLDSSEVVIDRDTNSGQAQSISLFMRFIPVFSYIDPYVRLTYTAGYDDGTEDDSVSLPPPRRLISACRIITADILRDWLITRQVKGMTNVLRLTTGDASISFQKLVARKDTAETSIPPRARDMLMSLGQAQRYSIGVG